MSAFSRMSRIAGAVAVCALAGCAGGALGPQVGGTRAPALDVLALDFERTIITKGARVSGTTARAQAALKVSTATQGLLRREATGPIPTEVRVEVAEMVTSGGKVRMAGKVVLRDLALGTVLAELDDFNGQGQMPAIERGGSREGLVFRGVEDQILEWLRGLECDTGSRTCGPPLVIPGTDGGANPDGDLELAAMVGRRPGGLRKLNSGGIDPEKIVAAAAPPEAASETAGAKKIGSTVAALGMLDRSGFWLKTPLVKAESPGEVVLVSTGQRLAVTLIPKDGPAGGGSQISLAALTELGADMTALLSLDVYR